MIAFDFRKVVAFLGWWGHPFQVNKGVDFEEAPHQVRGVGQRVAVLLEGSGPIVGTGVDSNFVGGEARVIFLF